MIDGIFFMGEAHPLSCGRLWYVPMSEGMYQYVDEDVSRLLFGEEQILLIYSLSSVFCVECWYALWEMRRNVWNIEEKLNL